LLDGAILRAAARGDKGKSRAAAEEQAAAGCQISVSRDKALVIPSRPRLAREVCAGLVCGF
jgi:hypothetical protein